MSWTTVMMWQPTASAWNRFEHLARARPDQLEVRMRPQRLDRRGHDRDRVPPVSAILPGEDGDERGGPSATQLDHLVDLVEASSVPSR